MSESEFTPRPWFYGQDGFNLGNGVVYSRHANGNPKDICLLHGWDAEKQANAKLLHAAPDLLAAAIEALAVISRMKPKGNGSGTEVRLTQAIQKATA